MLSRIALPALALAACSGAAGNETGPPAGGNKSGPANVAQPATAASPLTGLWYQTGATCARGRAATVEELEFEPGGRALVTFGAFETYHDYWGPYRYDAATGALSMSVERGNSIPTDLDLEGRATFPSSRELVVEGISFGAPHGEGPAGRNCTLRFTRRR